VYIAAMPVTNGFSDANAPFLNPLVVVRGFSFTAMVLVGLAMLFTGHESVRSVCLGGAFGVLIGTTVFTFGMRNISLKHAERATAKRRYPAP
jgi:hypothetical protein